jgi:hypothetical protein
MPIKREFRPRKRRSGVRSPKLIIIATEGTKTEPRYFNDLVSPQYFYNSRVHVEVLEREDLASAPEYVVRVLDEFRSQYKLKPGLDELWLVIDTDQWGDAKLSAIGTLCYQKEYGMAVSNPCFELWLLLHHRSLSEYTAEVLDEFRENRRIGDRTRLGSELVAVVGEYSRSALKTDHFLPYVQNAIERARALDTHPEHRWPNDLGSRVYLLVERIINRHPYITAM